MEMNGRKILNRLITLFIAINVILFVFLSVRRGIQYQLPKERVDNIIAVLADKNITVKCELPRDFKPKSSATLTYTGDSVSTRNDLVSTLFGSSPSKILRSTGAREEDPSSKIYYFTKEKEQLSFDQQEIVYVNSKVDVLTPKPSLPEAKRMAETFIKRLKLGQMYSSSYVEAREEEHCFHLIYFPVFNNIPLFDLPIEMKVFKEGIGSATLYLGEVNQIEDSKGRITPIDLVLFGIEAYIPENNHMVIEDITLGYKKIQKKGSNLWGEQIIPAYKIVIEGLENPIFVNAYTNEIVK